MNVKFFYCLLIVFSLCFTACSNGEDGIDGIDGIDGVDGIDGIDGVDGVDGMDGAQGPQGPAGSANVIYSNWLSFQQAQRDTLVDGSNLKVNHIPAPTLTQNHIDRGAILVYWRYLNTVIQLPYTSDAGSGSGPDKTSTISFIPKPGKLYITRYTHDNTASVGFGTINFRYIIIPGGMQGSLENIDLNDFEAVKAALNL